MSVTFRFSSFSVIDTSIILLQNSVNARYQTIPYPWLVFGEKIKVNTVFIRDSTGVSDSVLILYGGSLHQGVQVIFLLAFEPKLH